MIPRCSKCGDYLQPMVIEINGVLREALVCVNHKIMQMKVKEGGWNNIRRRNKISK